MVSYPDLFTSHNDDAYVTGLGTGLVRRRIEGVELHCSAHSPLFLPHPGSELMLFD